MKKHVFVLILTIFPVVLISMVSSLFPTDISAKKFALNIREVTYNISTHDAKGGLRYKVVTIKQEDNFNSYLTCSATPLYALSDLGYSISNSQRFVSTSPIDLLYNNSYIRIKSLETIIEEVKSDIEFQRVIQSGGTLCKSLSDEVVDQEGVLGLMTSTIKKVYEDGYLIAEEVIAENIDQEPRNEIVILVGPDDTPNVQNQPNTYDCSFWEAYINASVQATDEEKRWLKKIMYYESGCNAASDKNPKYKGLYQWDPCFWYKQFPNENIYDGKAQIKNTLWKLRQGADPNKMWPHTHSIYKSKYGELSWLD